MSFENVPNELLAQIFGYTKFADLRSLSKVSKYCHALMEPLLYKTVKPWGLGTALLVRTITTDKPSSAQYIQNFDAVYDASMTTLGKALAEVDILGTCQLPLGLMRSSTYRPKIGGLWSRVLKKIYPDRWDAMVALLVSLFSNLQGLHLDFADRVPDTFIKAVIVSAGVDDSRYPAPINRLSHLTTVTLRVDPHSVMTIQDILPFMRLRAIKHMEVLGLDGEDPHEDTKRELCESSITSLVLRGALMDNAQLRPLLRCLSNLESLTSVHGGHLEVPDIFASALSKVGHRLESLRILASHFYDADEREYPAQIRPLNSFTVLKEICVPVGMLMNVHNHEDPCDIT